MSLLDIIAKAFAPKQIVPLSPPSLPVAVEIPAPVIPSVVLPLSSPTFDAPTQVAANPNIHGVGIRVDHLLKMGVSQANALKYVGFLNESCEKYKINNHARITAFISQTCEESGNLSAVNENLNYRPEVICRLWPRFTLAQATAACKAGPEAVGNLIYGNRMGNVNPGDGYRFRGRGFIQLTGRDNYTASSKRLGVDLIGNPDLVSSPEYAALTAADYWANAGCNEMSDPDSEAAVKAVTRRINGGYINLDTRLAYWRKAGQIFSDLK